MARDRIILSALLLLIAACGREPAPPAAARAPHPSPLLIDTTAPVTYQGDWLYVNGERFYVKGVCFFENHSVNGEFRRTPLAQLDEEFRAIKSLGFNTIRSQLTREEIELAARHGLMVMQAANHLFFTKEFRDSAEIASQVAVTRRISAECHDLPNILYWIVDNEPDMPSLFAQGADVASALHARLVATVKAESPRAIVSMAACPLNVALDFSFYDVVSLNLYPFCPGFDAIGYDGYCAWFKRRFAPDRPLIISEYGWQWPEVKPDMAERTAELLDEQIASGATGAFFYTWREFGPDTAPGMLWVGLVPNAGGPNDYRNPPIPLAHALSRYFEAVIAEPEWNSFHEAPLTVEVYGSDHTGSMTASVGADSVALTRVGRYWWQGRLATREAGQRVLVVTARDSAGNELARKAQPVHLGPVPAGVIVRIERVTERLQAGDTYQARILATDEGGRPLAGLPLRLALVDFTTNPWWAPPIEAATGADGAYLFTRPSVPAGYLTLAAAPAERGSRPWQGDVDVVSVFSK